MGSVPDVEAARSVDDLVAALASLRARAGQPSFSDLARMVGERRAATGSRLGPPGRVTVYDCFRTGRRRLDTRLVLDLVGVLGVDEAAHAAWQTALAAVSSGAAPDAVAPAIQVRTPPAAVGVLVGRDDLVARVVAGLGRGAAVVLSGLPGVGKTEVALTVAGLGARRDRPVLYVDLLGHRDPAPPAATVVDALAVALDVRPAGLEAWPHCRDRLVGSRAVVVLDNARDAAQVALVVTGLTGSGVALLVTSRRRLAGLVPATVHLDVEGLTGGDALALVASAGGVDAARLLAVDPGASADLVARAAGLPLDLGVLGAMVAARPAWSAADHLRRLDALPLDEGRRPALSAGYEILDAEARSLYRLLALHPDATVTVASAAALGGLGLDETRRVLERLAVEGLVRGDGPDRVRLHDVSRAHAAWVLADVVPHSAQRDAVLRLVRHLVERGVAASAGWAVGVDDEVRGSALRWWDAEIGAALGTMTMSRAWQVPAREAIALADAAWPYLDERGRLGDAIALLQVAVDLGRAESVAGVDLARTHRVLGRAYEEAGRLDEALHEVRLALDLGLDDDGTALNAVGNVLKRLGRYPEAATAYAASVARARELGLPVREGRSVGNLADIHRLMGHHDEAAAGFRRAIDLCEAHGDHRTLVMMLDNAALLAQARGDLDEAARLNARSTAGAAGLGGGIHSRVLLTTAILRHAGGDAEAALAALGDAQRIATESGLLLVEGDVLSYRGRVLITLGRLDEARAELERARALARAARALGSEASALNGLGQVASAAGDPSTAAVHHRHAGELAAAASDDLELAAARSGAEAAAAALAATAPDSGQG